MLVTNRSKTYTAFQKFHLLTLFCITLVLNILNIYCPAQKKQVTPNKRHNFSLKLHYVIQLIISNDWEGNVGFPQNSSLKILLMD